MACQYIITVGASLLEAPCFQNDSDLEEFVLNDRRLELDERQQVKSTIIQQLLPACGDNIRMFLQQHPFNKELWEKNKYCFLGAELATLRKIHKTKKNIQHDDTLHLFSSRKNSDGGICGSLLEQILKEIFPACSIKLHHFEKIDVSSYGDFAAGLNDAYHTAHELINESNDDVWLVLSGGYKAVVMMLAQLQMTHDRVTIASLHEDAKEGFLSLPVADKMPKRKSWQVPETEVENW